MKVEALSGGERNRLLLARLFLEGANVLVLDEPTNDLDIVTLQRAGARCCWASPGSVLLVTHDRYFLDKVATGLIVFEGGGELRRHAGGYDLYRRLKEQRDAEAAAAAAQVTRKAAAEAPRPAPAGRPRKLSWKEQRELEGLEAAILEAEGRKEALQARLADPALYTQAPDVAAKAGAEFRAATQQVDALYARWAELEEIASAAAGQ